MRGWRFFKCMREGKFFIEACRDYDTLSNSRCPYGCDIGVHEPYGGVPDGRLDADSHCNLEREVMLVEGDR